MKLHGEYIGNNDLYKGIKRGRIYYMLGENKTEYLVKNSFGEELWVSKDDFYIPV